MNINPPRRWDRRSPDERGTDMTQTVVITGASAGIGRSVAQLYGARGDRVGLLARGKAGLDGAVDDVVLAGGQALAIPTDMADFEQVDAAAHRIEDALGPIDVWINVAFASVFAPFVEIAPEEFKRVTEVSYLGFVHGTRVALDLMRPRDHGTIVQVGSALGERSIPLQSAYCGAKHAINGFTSAVRIELLHEKSNVHITVAQMPAVNTPQFSWVLSRLANHPQPVPPIYQPEVAARGVAFAADHPRRRPAPRGCAAGPLLPPRRSVGTRSRSGRDTGRAAGQRTCSRGWSPRCCHPPSTACARGGRLRTRRRVPRPQAGRSAAPAAGASEVAQRGNGPRRIRAGQRAGAERSGRVDRVVGARHRQLDL